VLSKGSPEKILDRCDKILINNQVLELTDETAKEIEKRIEEFQKNAGRVLAFAHKYMDQPLDFDKSRAEVEKEMIYDGFVVISDPLREDVYQAVSDCKRAGVDLKILTGDNIVTATAIAKQLEILDEGYIAVEARDIEDLNESEFKEALSKIRVIARSTPIIKMRVVNALKEMSNVVAVTGDGINDAPAIKSADVGIAMGISGTEVSKEASDIVLLDDSFSTIVKAVSWGRVIYENFQRFIQFQLTVNFSSVVTVLFSILAGFSAPFTALQLLWVNIIMDGPPALTLGLEPNRGNLMDRKPTPREANVVTKNMLFNIIFNGIIIFGIFTAQNKFNILGVSTEQKIYGFVYHFLWSFSYYAVTWP
jgi:Ca2+-transporting ATPase